MMHRLRMGLMGSVAIYRAPEGGEGGGGGGGGDPGAGGDPGDGGDPGAGGWKAPDGLPAEFVGADANETLGKVLTGYQQLNTRAEGLRGELARVPKAPETPDKYEYTPSETLKPYFPEGKPNPALDFARQAFHKHGVAAPAFQGIIEDLYGPMIEKGLLPQPYDPQAEIKTFQTAYGLDESGTTAAMTEAETFAKGLFGQLKGIPEPLAKAAQAEMLTFAETAGGMAVLRALQARLGENGIRVTGEGAGSGGPLSEAEFAQLGADPRIDPRNKFDTDPNKRFDPALRQRYDDAAAAIGQKKYGETARQA